MWVVSSEAAKDGRFDFGSVTASGGPVTARAAAVGALALSPQQWTLEIRPLSEYGLWAGYPAGLRRDVSADFGPKVRELWEAVQKTPGPGPMPQPAPKVAAAPKGTGGLKAKPKPPAAPAVQKGVRKQAGGTPPKLAPKPQSPLKRATGGRGYVARAFRLIRGKRAPKDRCGTCVSYAWDHAAHAWACTTCLRILEGKAGKTKSKRPGA